jgi:sortase A
MRTMTRYRFLIFAGLAVAVVAAPVIVSRTALDPVTRIVEERGRADYNKRQAALRRALQSPEYRESWRNRTLQRGDAFARLIIPRLGVDLIVVEGTSGDSLRNGAGHYPDSLLPGERGNVAIAGHRTGAGEPFLHLQKLTAGDLLYLTTPDGRFTYHLMPPFDGHTNPWVTDPLDWSTIGPVEAAVATLTTTDPPHTSKNRLIARFALLKKEPG